MQYRPGISPGYDPLATRAKIIHRKKLFRGTRNGKADGVLRGGRDGQSWGYPAPIQNGVPVQAFARRRHVAARNVTSAAHLPTDEPIGLEQLVSRRDGG